MLLYIHIEKALILAPELIRPPYPLMPSQIQLAKNAGIAGDFMSEVDLSKPWKGKGPRLLCSKK